MSYGLQCVAVCCSVLQCVAVWCSVLQCVAVFCSVLQCVICICICMWVGRSINAAYLGAVIFLHAHTVKVYTLTPWKPTFNLCTHRVYTQIYTHDAFINTHSVFEHTFSLCTHRVYTRTPWQYTFHIYTHTVSIPITWRRPHSAPRLDFAQEYGVATVSRID